MIEMLRLCPGDNLNQRALLGSVLVRVGRTADALSFARNWLEKIKSGEIPERGGTNFSPASDDVLSTALEERLTNGYAKGEIAYTGALASFKLYGGCPLACQFLRIAAKNNPTVLMRILARVRQPSETIPCP